MTPVSHILLVGRLVWEKAKKWVKSMSNFDESSPHAFIPSHHTYNQLKKPHQQYYSNRIRLSFPKKSKANATLTHRPIDQTKRVAVFRPWRFLGIACLLLSSAQSPPAFHGCIADHYTCRLGRVSLTNALQNSVRHYHLATTPILRSQVAIAPRPRPCYLLATKTQFQLPPSDSRPGMAKSFMQVLSDDRRSPCIPCSRHL